jgi:hypothetical protein
MEKRSTKDIILYLSMIFCSCFAVKSQSQQIHNQYNPYVSNSEAWKLMEFGINLFEEPYDDISFQENVRKSLEMRQNVINNKYGFYAMVSATSFSLLYATSNLILDKEYYPELIFDSNGIPSPHPKAGERKSVDPRWFVFSAIGIGCSIGIKVRLNKKKKLRDEQIAKTKAQFDLLK